MAQFEKNFNKYWSTILPDAILFEETVIAHARLWWCMSTNTRGSGHLLRQAQHLATHAGQSEDPGGWWVWYCRWNGGRGARGGPGGVIPPWPRGVKGCPGTDPPVWKKNGFDWNQSQNGDISDKECSKKKILSMIFFNFPFRVLWVFLIFPSVYK